MQSPWHCPQQANGVYTHTHTPKPVHEQEAISTVETSSTHRQEVIAKRPDIIIKNKRENTHTDR